MAFRTTVLAAMLVLGTAAPGCKNAQNKAKVPPKPVMIQVATGPLAPLVEAEMARAKKDAAFVVVYVGADWCEPCTRFKKSLAAGEFDKSLQGLRLLALDEDQDDERLKAAGYDGSMIPRFVVPAVDGRAGPNRIEGSIKGPGAPAEIVPRLRGLVANSL